MLATVRAVAWRKLLPSRLSCRVTSRCRLPASGGAVARCKYPRDHQFSTCGALEARTTSKKKLKDIVQGPIDAKPLPPIDNDEVESQTMLQVVRSNMLKYPDCVLLTRVGNFYELYFEHASQYAPLLNLKVAAKGKNNVAMAGFTISQLRRYLKVLVRDLGKQVAICEEFPKYGPDGQPGYPIQRRVSRIVSAGSVIEEELMDPTQNNFLLAIHSSETASDAVPDRVGADVVGLAWLDLPTGQFFLQKTIRSSLPAILLHIDPREVVLDTATPSDLVDEIKASLGTENTKLTFHDADRELRAVPNWNYKLEKALEETELLAYSNEEKLAGDQLLQYARTRLIDSDLTLQQPQRREANQDLWLDRSSVRGLELFKTARDGFGKGSLINTIKKTITQSGTRLLRERLNYPSRILEEIEYRQNIVSSFVESDILRENVRAHLRTLFDVQRIVQKFSLCQGGPDDMTNLATAITGTAAIASILQAQSRRAGSNSAALRALAARFNLEGPQKVSERVRDSIDERGMAEWQRRSHEDQAEDNEDPQNLDDASLEGPQLNTTTAKQQAKLALEWKLAMASFADPWRLKPSASEELKSLHAQLTDLKSKVRPLQDELRIALSSTTLKLAWKPGFGYYCHMSKLKGFDESALSGVHGRDIGSTKTTRSIMVRAWSELGRALEDIKYRIRIEEDKTLGQLRQLILDNIVALRRNAVLINETDVAAAFATQAIEQGWVRPIVNETTTQKIVGGRHPTVKLGREEQGLSFVSNDMTLGSDERAWLVTGPNMAGKSTFLRQNALIIVLAQAGSYVPADYAEIGIVDKIFSRIGAADDLFRNQSTFMVEMLETADILKNATPQSFVIMDEVGRGTTPEDGTAVAFASLYHLYHINKCRTLFATHFHEVADRTIGWTNLGHYCTDIHEDDSGSFSFIHKLHKGINRQSHALKVAKMAQIPPAALEVAEKVRQELMAK